jgi:hypothetical protein
MVQIEVFADAENVVTNEISEVNNKALQTVIVKTPTGNEC